MPDRHSVLQAFFLGVDGSAYNPEASQGAVTRRIMSMGLNPQPKGEFRYHAPQGDSLESDAILTKEWAELGIEGIPTYNEMGYLLASILEKPNNAGAGVATGSGYYHDFYYRSRTEENAHAYSVEFGNSVRAEGYAHATVTDFEMNLARGATDLKATMLAKRLDDGYTLTTAPDEQQTIDLAGATSGTFKIRALGKESGAIAYNANAAAVQAALDAADLGVLTAGGAAAAWTVDYDGDGTVQGMAHPLLEIVNSTDGTFTVAKATVGGHPEMARQIILPSSWDIFAHNTYASIGSGQLTRAFLTNFKIGGVRSPFWTQNDAELGFTSKAKTLASIEATVLVMADSNGMAFLTNARNNTSTHLRLVSTGAAIGGGANYGMQIDMAAKVRQLPTKSDSDGIYAAEFVFGARFDPDLGRSLKIRLTNEVDTYAS